MCSPGHIFFVFITLAGRQQAAQATAACQVFTTKSPPACQVFTPAPSGNVCSGQASLPVCI